MTTMVEAKIATSLPGSHTEKHHHEQAPVHMQSAHTNQLEPVNGVGIANGAMDNNVAGQPQTRSMRGFQFPETKRLTIRMPQAVQATHVDQNHMTVAPTGNAPSLGAKSTVEQKKAENQKKAEELRAKLIAQRQNTPVQTFARSSSATHTNQHSSSGPVKSEPEQDNEVPDDLFGLESLLAEGKAAAESRMKEEVQPPAPKPVQSIEQKEPSAPKEIIPQTKSRQENLSMSLTHAYYADLQLWLEITGYHDVDYRNSKLSGYKERQRLEQEAARIAQRLEQLKQGEQANLASMRCTPAFQLGNTLSRPPLPAVMPCAAQAANQTIHATKPANAVKRAHSPEPKPAPSRKEAKHDTHIRGVDSPMESNYGRLGRSPAPVGGNNEGGLERRISYPDARPGDNRHGYGLDRRGRDPSLERHQSQFYGRGALPIEPYYKQDSYRPVRGDPRPDRRGNDAHLAYSQVNHGGGARRYGNEYHDENGMDLMRGDVRFFIIKSWNHQNVQAAMRDGVWATQEKNERMLREAFESCGQVTLFFSVNKSMAFQGYAVMTSPPDKSLPKPAFCAKLHWPSSPAFTLRWVATTDVPFRYTAHLKNEFNLNDDRMPHAVIVGKDGQEISPVAGNGLGEILANFDMEARGEMVNGVKG